MNEFEDVEEWLEFTPSPADRNIMAEAMLQRMALKNELFARANPEKSEKADCDRFLGNYEYDALPQRSIRLLKIYPYLESHFEPLVVSLHTVSLDDGISFDALLYTWGPPTWAAKAEAATEVFTRVSRCYPVYCGARLLQVTRNLRDALSRLRQILSSERGREYLKSNFGVSTALHIWIDELCINQEHLEERNQQVCLWARSITKQTRS